VLSSVENPDDPSSVPTSSFTLGPFIDEKGVEICMAYLENKCSAKVCPQRRSHGAIYISDSELNKVGACIEVRSLMLAVVQIFGPEFQWRNQRYISSLFFALSEDRYVVSRRDPMTRRHEVIREQTLVKIRVLTYTAYMELMTVCEEAFSRVKPFSKHQIFFPAKNRFNSPADPYDLNNLGCVICNDDTLAQYNKGILVPFKKSKMKHLRKARLKGEIEVGKDMPRADMHINLFRTKADEAADMINRLFK
jgi:hypothetical protein